jgi:NDMA-dependent alcohol dehydrogenase
MATARAALCTAPNQKLELVELELDAPRAREVRVRIAASGVCHTDHSFATGAFPAALPMVLGHEGAGIVEEVGPDVSRVRPGDHVVLSWMPQCGQCRWCTRGQPQLCAPGLQSVMAGGLADLTPRFSREGKPVAQMSGLGTFASCVVVQEASVVPIDRDVPLTTAALFGCAVLTGVGAAVNTATIRDGDDVVVVGCGGVGLNVIQGAVLAGAGRVIAVDRFPAKLSMAKEFGAAEVVDASTGDAVSAVFDLTGGVGADVAFEVVGRPDTAQQVLTMTRRGGEACMVGMAPLDANLVVPLALEMVVNEKRIIGCNYGSADVRRDVPKFLEWWRTGRLPVERLISRTIGLDGVNDAVASVGSGELHRTVIAFEQLAS